MRWLLVLALSALSLGQFKSNAQQAVESVLMAPCCGGGTLAEHEENRYTYDMKQIMFTLMDSTFNKQKVDSLFTVAYSDAGMYRLHFAPAVKNLREIKKYVDANVHAGMSLDQIVDVFAWIHGEVIRSSPKHSGLGNLAWFMPWVILIIGIGVILKIMRKFVSRQRTQPASTTGENFDPDFAAKIEKEIKELDL